MGRRIFEELNSGVHLSPSQRTAVAVEFVAVFAEAAKKRQIEGGRAGAEVTNSTRGRVGENLPEPEKPRPPLRMKLLNCSA